MITPTELMYTKNDEWVRIEANTATIGVTDYAQDQLSDIVYVEILVVEDEKVNKGDSCASIESVKAAADVYVPVSGKIIAVNEDLEDTPELINSDPFGSAWMVKIEMSDPSELDELINSEGYLKLIEEKE